MKICNFLLSIFVEKYFVRNYVLLKNFSPTISSITCQNLNTQLNFELPDLHAGDYKLIVRSSEYGVAKNVIDLTYKLKLDNMLPAKIGTGGGSIITMFGQGFGDGSDITATLCGSELASVKG